jgi:hypothetical protein
MFSMKMVLVGNCFTYDNEVPTLRIKLYSVGKGTLVSNRKFVGSEGEWLSIWRIEKD